MIKIICWLILIYLVINLLFNRETMAPVLIGLIILAILLISEHISDIGLTMIECVFYLLGFILNFFVVILTHPWIIIAVFLLLPITDSDFGLVIMFLLFLALIVFSIYDFLSTLNV